MFAASSEHAKRFNNVSCVEIVKKRGSGIILGITYAVGFAMHGVLFPFMPIILRGEGLSDAEVSLVLSGAGLAAIFGPMLFAHLADRKIQFRRLMPLLMIASGVMMEALKDAHSVSQAFTVVFLLYLFLIPALTLLDSFTMEFIGKAGGDGKARSFQDYRIWGSIGFMVPGIALGLGAFGANPYSLHILSMGVFVAGGAALCAWGLPSNSPNRGVATLPSKEALLAITKTPLREFFIATIFWGTGLAIYHVSFPRFLQELGCSMGEIGLVINLGVLYEILIMPFASRLIRVLGLRWIIFLAFVSIPLRMAISVTFPSFPVIVAVQVLHAPLVLGLLVAAPIFIREQAGSSYRFSLQSLYATLSLGITRFVGPILGAGIVGMSGGAPPLQGLLRLQILTGIFGALAAFVFYRVCRAPIGEGTGEHR
jgi:PPP family 3-phenylpropionic acid transporter